MINENYLSAYKKSSKLCTLDWQFGEMLVRNAKVADGEDKWTLLLLGARTLHAVQEGHTCLDLEKWLEPSRFLNDFWHSGDEGTSQGRAEDLPEANLSLEALKESLHRHPEIVSVEGQGALCPLVLKDNLLYLHKYLIYEKDIKRILTKLLNQDTTREKSLMDSLYPTGSIYQVNDYFKDRTGQPKSFDNDLQQQAVYMAMTKRFSVLTGGPGTGKTTSLACILALQLQLYPGIRIALAAPTARAAKQIEASIAIEKEHLHLNAPASQEEVMDKLSALKGCTLHKLLGLYINSDEPKYNQKNPLPFDLVVVDEMSMASLQQTALLFRALPKDCKLLLLGDQYQLASVEAGTVMADLCQFLLRSYPDNMVTLLENHRSNKIPDVQRFISAMQTDNKCAAEHGLALSLGEEMEAVIKVLYCNPNERVDNFYVSLPLQKTGSSTVREKKQAFASFLEKEVEELLEKGGMSLEEWKSLKAHRSFASTPSMDTPADTTFATAWNYIDNMRILSGVHEGLYGEKNINALMASMLDKPLYKDGAPVMILKNDPVSGLANGDVGMCWAGRIFFPVKNASGLSYGLSFKPAEIPPHCLVYAMTIHKSQGGGFDNVMMMLSDEPRQIPLITRELVYTGITRTKLRFMLCSPRHVFEKALVTPTQRWSGFLAGDLDT